MENPWLTKEAKSKSWLRIENTKLLLWYWNPVSQLIQLNFWVCILLLYALMSLVCIGIHSWGYRSCFHYTPKKLVSSHGAVAGTLGEVWFYSGMDPSLHFSLNTLYFLFLLYKVTINPLKVYQLSRQPLSVALHFVYFLLLRRAIHDFFQKKKFV